MARMALRDSWKKEMGDKILAHEPIEYTSNFKPCIQFLVMKLGSSGTPYKLYNLGVGVTKITTTTDTCPCCKRKL